MKYRRSILPAILKTLPLTVFNLMAFSILYAFEWWYTMLIINSIFTFFTIVEILDHYLDYITISNDEVYIHYRNWLFHEESKNIPKNQISNITATQSFWQRLFLMWNLTFSAQWIDYKFDNITQVNKIKALLN